MQYTLFTNQFGGLNYRSDPATIGPAGAQENSGVDTSQGVATPASQVSTATLSYSVTSCGTFGTTQVLGTNDATRADYDFGIPFTYSEYNGRVIRIPRCTVSTVVSSAWVPQYSTSASSPVWHALGIKAPPSGMTMGTGGVGALTGTYLAVLVFYNAFGEESPPCASVTFSPVSNDIDYGALPIGYGTGTITSGSPTVTGVTNISYFRVGMRITSPTAGIPAGTYITNIVGNAIDLSKNATATPGAPITLQDVQVTGRRIYRTTASGTTYYRTVDIGNVTATTSTGDNTSDAALEVLSTLSTDTDDDTLPAIYGGTISPDGVLMGITATLPGLGILAFTKTDGLMLTKGTYRITIGKEVSQLCFAINRFLVFTPREVYFILGGSAADFDVIKTSAIAPVTNLPVYYGGLNPVEMPDGSVWFTSLLGVTRFDGNAIEAITRDVFTDAQNAVIGRYAFAAAYDRGRYIVLTSTDTLDTVRALVFDPAIPGWRWLTNDDNTFSSRTSGAIWIDPSSVPTVAYYYLDTTEYTHYPLSSPDTSGVYWTGEWSGERRSSLKKFRRVSVLHNGNVTVQPYVNGAVAGSAQSLSRTTLGRSVFWLPSETRGRVCSMKLTLTNATAEVHEIGVWVGEERGPMP